METYPFTGKPYQGFLESLKKEDYVLIEATTNAFWFYDQVVARVKACYVYDVNKGRTEGNKTDKIDARKLAKKLMYHVVMGEAKKELPTVYVPAPAVRELRGLFCTYGLYKKIKIQLKNRMHSVLKQNGICIGRKELDRLDFPERVEGFAIAEIWKAQLRSLMREKEKTEEEQEKIKGRLYALGNELFPKEIELLMSIRGFSPLTAIALMSDAVDVNRFSNAKRFCSYLRVAPKVTASNKTVHLGTVNKKSRSTTCSLLTQSVLHFAEAGEHMNQFYERVKVGKSPGKYRIALVRKVLVSAYHMLRKGELFFWVDEESYQGKVKEFTKELKRIERAIAEEEKEAA
jgi:transposase